MSNKDFGFNVIGHVSGNLGLGVSARNVIQTLLDNGFPVAVLDIDPGIGRGKHDLRFESLSVCSPEALPYPVNLLIFPPPTLVASMPQYRALLCDPDRFNAAFTWWELPVLPSAWLPTLEFFDVLVAPSEFIRHTLDVGLSRATTVAAQHPLYLPPNVVPDRRRFGLDPDDLVFITSFELSSDPARKNVLAVVEAFERGLTQVPEARLLVKLNNAENVSPKNRIVVALQDAGARDPRIRVLADPLSYYDVLRLYASCDVFVSLHRAEGLGLGPMEAMALGKVVIATAWSGNMDYMDHMNACLVPYTLVPATGGRGTYSASELGGAVPIWADPEVSEAAAWMRRLASDRELRAAIGARAATRIERFHATAVKGRFAFEIKALWEHRLYTQRRPRRAALGQLETASPAPAILEPTKATNFRKAAMTLLDRHLLWRFRGS